MLAFGLVAPIVTVILGLLAEVWQLIVACVTSPVCWVIAGVVGVPYWLGRQSGRRDPSREVH